MNDVGGWRELGMAVILQAILDTKDKDEAKARDAAAWLTSNDLPLWLEAVGLPNIDMRRMVKSGNLHKIHFYQWRI